ncbi:hypothetical protein PoB_001180800 [Plakobranchus ocellatus]|uniref:Uncharacterized protein n=1 Tax=Plakobranchus ocellatus TaxID=259542 RepID=A0AAV3YSF3_9GAST|nr:hypothetical protein PoB_001180800 [Plakobranchus ocellatus]
MIANVCSRQGSDDEDDDISCPQQGNLSFSGPLSGQGDNHDRTGTRDRRVSARRISGQILTVRDKNGTCLSETWHLCVSYLALFVRNLALSSTSSRNLVLVTDLLPVHQRRGTCLSKTFRYLTPQEAQRRFDCHYFLHGFYCENKTSFFIMKYVAVFLSVLALVVVAAQADGDQCLVDNFTQLDDVVVDCSVFYNTRPYDNSVYCCEHDGYVPFPKVTVLDAMSAMFSCECLPATGTTDDK